MAIYLEKLINAKQKLAAVAGDPKKIEAVDLKTIAKKRMKKRKKNAVR